MAKQKVVIRVLMEDKKKQSKVMQTVVKHLGVSSVGIEGEDKVTVVGDDVDAVILTQMLRKETKSHAQIITVSPVDEKKEEKKEKATEPVVIVPPGVLYLDEPRQQSDCCLM